MNFSSYRYLLKYSVAKHGAIQAYKEAISNQFLSDSDLNELSWHKTKTLLHHAYSNVPWYKNKYSAMGLHPNDITKEEYFSQVPVLNRSELAENFSLFVSQKINPKTLKISTTGGSTGNPVKIGTQKKGLRELQKWQMFSWWDLELKTNMASIYRGLPVTGYKKAALNIINWPQKVIRMDATQMTQQKIDDFIRATQSVQPKLIHGYVGALDAIADYLIENNILLPSPKVVWATAAPITAIQEEKISRAFNAPVCDQYGCSEMYFIAAECPHKNGLHVFSDSIKLEILDKKNEPLPSESYGKIVLTNLNEFDFPLIRYENGDTGRFLNKKCSCGINLPLMDKVKGRISDNIALPNGTILSGEYLTTIYDDYTDKVKQFQVVRKKDGSIVINIVLYTKSAQNEIETHTKKEFQTRIQNQVPVKINFVEKIEAQKGKLQFIIKEQ